ncbi:DUF192 domain-containing protein [Alcaligenaceae bacterium LF4-65]|jgi:uncharacterized membrane protein (UPF0127 family)|uniref:DUF192 domain-containing protein n=1 Tax=Zwartia hollandica TaxID=324606 RepID=A0A953N7R1_9BURK|nr:DUF192 domain-containing protein [Zwartia hollandica]
MTELERTGVDSLKVYVARGFFARARGLLLRHPMPSGCVLYFPDCRSVHTFGMTYPLTIIFLDRQHQVVGFKRKVMPNRIVTCRLASAVCEMTWRKESEETDSKISLLAQSLKQLLAGC